MSILNVINRNLNLKYLRVQYFVQQKICQQLIVQRVKYQKNPNAHCTSTYGIGNIFLHNTNTTRSLPWKCLLAISLLYAGYDSESELKA